MLRKLRLDQTKKYEIAFAANSAAFMLVAFINGRKHYLSIGSEQGIEKWDDFIIEIDKNNYKHIQVKRQLTAFSNDNPIRDTYIQGNRQGVLRDLSPLDASMKSLADFIQLPPAVPAIQRVFKLVVPSLNIDVKAGLPLRELHSFCENQLNNLTTEAGLRALESASPATKNLFDWLRTWCGFHDYAHIIKGLSKFEVVQSGNENDLNAETVAQLSSCFTQPEAVLENIVSFIDANSSFTSAITPRPLLLSVQYHLLPTIPSWTQFRRNGSNWEVSGTHDRANESIENAGAVVPALWEAHGVGMLKYHSDDHSTGKLPRAIIRLALHFQPNTQAYIGNMDSWTMVVKGMIGSTLGLGEDDCDILSTRNDPNCYDSSNTRTLGRLDEHDGEAEFLSSEMHTKTWMMLCTALNHKIASMDATELRSAIEERWLLWKVMLDSNINQQIALCKSMLHPLAEGEDIIAELRIGPKTVPLLAQGIFLLLAVAVCLSDPSNDWNAVNGQLTINTKALSYWSGPSGKPRKVRKITDEGISSLLGKEPSKILLLSKIDSASSDILEVSLAEDDEFAGSMASSRRPILLITNSPKISRLIIKGNIEALRSYLQTELEKGLKSKLLSED